MRARRFTDKVVIITGGSAGIGLAAARFFGEEGAKVVLFARGADALEKARADLEGRGAKVATLAIDVAAPGASERIVAFAKERFGGVDILVNNAGAHARGPFTTRKAAELGHMIDVNLRAPIELTHHAVTAMKATGSGAVVNVASLAGMVPTVGSATYSATKFGLRAFSMALADELAGTGITVSIVSPGPVDTQFIMSELDTVTDLTMSQPLVTAEEVAELILDCAHDGKVERAAPRVSGMLATLGYFAPALRRALRPALEARGRKAKARLRAERG
ncbi:MAG: SDR family NAD(P)-dependent oxidoreductase [Polyangiaceae bacterium]